MLRYHSYAWITGTDFGPGQFILLRLPLGFPR